MLAGINQACCSLAGSGANIEHCHPADNGIRLLLFVFRHDTDQDGVVSIREVALVFRSIGCNPTEAELQVL